MRIFGDSPSVSLAAASLTDGGGQRSALTPAVTAAAAAAAVGSAGGFTDDDGSNELTPVSSYHVIPEATTRAPGPSFYDYASAAGSLRPPPGAGAAAGAATTAGAAGAARRTTKSSRVTPLVENATLLYDFCGDFRENRIDLSVYSPKNNVLLDY